jgi:predicted metal-dependent HD superfamily phosphohydrolase
MNDTNIKALCNQAESWYRFNDANRQYHNWQHARDVVKRLWKMDNDPKDETLLAAYWHDAVYVPKAGSDANERCSAAALGCAARSYNDKETLDTVSKAQDLILYTKLETHLHENRIVGELAKLLDCDLGSLAYPYDEFIHIQRNIIHEQGGTVEDNTVDSQKFLTMFLECREFIYHTDYGREHWEDIAKSNIKRYLKG